MKYVPESNALSRKRIDGGWGFILRNNSAYFWWVWSPKFLSKSQIILPACFIPQSTINKLILLFQKSFVWLFFLSEYVCIHTFRWSLVQSPKPTHCIWFACMSWFTITSLASLSVENDVKMNNFFDWYFEIYLFLSYSDARLVLIDPG